LKEDNVVSESGCIEVINHLDLGVCSRREFREGRIEIDGNSRC